MSAVICMPNHTNYNKLEHKKVSFKIGLPNNFVPLLKVLKSINKIALFFIRPNHQANPRYLALTAVRKVSSQNCSDPFWSSILSPQEI
jgi:hypothetical protein